MPGFNRNADGTLKQFTTDEIVAMEIRTAGVKDGSHPTFEQGFRSSVVRREWFCKWSALDDVICLFLGGASTYSGGVSGLAMTRLMPAFMPGRPNYLAMEIERAVGTGSCGQDDANTIPAYDKARFMVRYEQVFFNTAADSDEGSELARYVEVLPSTTETNRIMLPGSMMAFRRFEASGEPEGRPIPYNIGRDECITKIGRKWHRVPRDVWSTSGTLYKRVKGNPDTGERAFIGTVNKYPIFGLPAGTLLLIGVDEEIIPDPTVSVPGGLGDYAFNLTYWWLQKTNGNSTQGWGHNMLYYGGVAGTGTTGYFLASKTSHWYAAGAIPDSTVLFDERDHSLLFEPGTG